jgi:phosphoglucosamine mutase
VRSTPAQLGLALDGDGDRSILVDERGELVDGDAHPRAAREPRDGSGRAPDPRIVATVMSNRGLHRALREAGSGRPRRRRDRPRRRGAAPRELPLGGEQSATSCFGRDHFYIGDGIYTALRVLRVLVETNGGRSPSWRRRTARSRRCS